MRKFLRNTVVALLAAAAVAPAGASITFSNIVIGGSLALPNSVVTGSQSIDFIFDDATVGDIVDPRRSGDIQITYEATSSVGLVQDQLVLSVLGALSGSGVIVFNETVEDLNNPGIIASYGVTLNSNDQLPHAATLNFSRTSNHVRVTKSIRLNAPATDAFDLSNVSLIEQTFREVPEPSALALLALGGLSLLRRR